ncbi:hypothetical protein ACD661_16355 [Legionella lytica]|uniref:Transposase n=1 Tax=Legionella lytica TaxID=96232 RepID=A0ABW8DE60_9GAMM
MQHSLDGLRKDIQIKVQHGCKKTYFRSLGQRKWLFYARLKGKQSGKEFLYLFTAAKVTIRRHIKIKADATPFDERYTDSFKEREQRNKIILKTERRWRANVPNMAHEENCLIIAGSIDVGFKKT